ncbi:diacylglycerol lipase-alpha isoform X3 [Euwallacea similis]|uniref:diacylglycerol lipase-alpha isoform X3 n=1 Tax=Euwallacea similis TaxID=1736056 RepID=UPI00344E6079
MPGLIVFRRRWSVGSDDLVVPGAFLFTTHLIWTIILGIVLFVVKYDKSVQCVLLLWGLIVGYLAILLLSMVLELAVCVVALRGSILDTGPRSSMQYILYIRLSVMIIEAGWLTAGIVWLSNYYLDCSIENAKETVLAMVVFNWCILLSVLITVWCCYDTAGRSWVKMKQYQRSMRESESKFQYKRSGSTRNWRQSLVETRCGVCVHCENHSLSTLVLQRCDVPFFVISRMKVLRAYQDSWHNRCRFLFCCSSPSDRNRNSFADIARLLSDFFRDLDVVPSDVVVGLVLLRKFQKIERKAIVEQRKNATYEFLSGVAITPRTQFLSLHEDGADLELFQTVIHYAHFAVRAYGWPIYIMMNKTGACHLCTGLHCCCFPCRKRGEDGPEVVDDNCCRCNYAALQKLTDLGDIEIVYATYHVDVGETPFFVALDYDRKKIVISIRGTLSMKDILTDLNAESETIPLNPPREDWTGHKGMVHAATYIYDKIEQEQLVEKAKARKLERGTRDFEIVIVGHSLGAGIASILGILMRQTHPSLQCFCYSPPGGLLSAPAVEYTKEFTLSVVIGKDVVPRIGLHQMETLRTDLINAIKRSVDPKWKTITCSIICCGCSQPTSAVEMSTGETEVCEYMRSKENARCMGIHPSDSSIALTSHQPLYPPGRIVHVVRHHPTSGQQKYEKRWRQALSKKEPVYQALWAGNTDFDEVLISPVMIQDHMPDKVLEALNKVVTTMGPKKPHRSSSTSESATTNYYSTASNPNQMFLETSFTSLQSPSSNSSITNGYFSTKSHPSPLSIHQPLSGFNLSFRSNRSDVGQMPLTKYEEPPSITKSLSLNLVPKVDLIYDDWLGLAPLASPESMSELSSISSRTSLVATSVIVEVCRTPKIMRRTPKIIGNLSTCADDLRNVRNFENCKKFPLCSNNNNNTESSSSSNVSFESASSNNKCCGESSKGTGGCNKDFLNVECTFEGRTSSGSDFQSAEDILDNVLTHAGCKEFFSSDPNILEMHQELLMEGSPPPVYFISSPSTPVYPQLLSPGTPQELDPDILSNLAIDLASDDEPRTIQFHQSKSASSADSGSICRTPSDTTKNVTFNPQVITVDTICEANYSPPIRWRLFKGKKQKQQMEVPKPPPIPHPASTAVPIKTILSKGKRPLESEGDNREYFARTEGLPLLSGLSNSVDDRTPSPIFARRKKCVFPSDIVVMNKPPHESAV